MADFCERHRECLETRRPVSGSGVTSQKINRVRYYIEARSALRRRRAAERERETEEYLLLLLGAT